MNKILIMQKGMRTWQLVSILTIASLLMSAFPAGFVAAEATTTDEVTSPEAVSTDKLPQLTIAETPASFMVENQNPEGPKTNVPTTPSFATVVAHKIICTDETDLPNYGKGGPDITETTAIDWVASHKSCSLAEGWNFQYTTTSAYDPGDTMVGEAGAPWQTFGPTDSNGQTSVKISAEQMANNPSIRLREVLQAGYIPFTHDGDNSNGNNVSAEFYCHTDVLNYDNDDYIKGGAGVEMGKTYQCVAWNSPTPQPQTCSLTLLSDTGTLVAETNEFAVPTYDENSRWTADVPGATWVWADAEVQNPTGTETNTFIDTFTVATPTVATLTVAADNLLDLYVNGVPVLPAVPANTYLGEKVYNILPYLVSGSNELKFVVTNEAQAGGTYQSNPAGVLYRLDLTGEADCARTTKPKDEPEPEPETVTSYLDVCTVGDTPVVLETDWDATHTGEISTLGGDFNITSTATGLKVALTKNAAKSWQGVKGTITLPSTATGISTSSATGFDKLETPDNMTGTYHHDIVTISGTTISFELANDTANDVFYIDFDANCEEPETTTVTMCKLDQNEKSLSGWQLALLGDKVETLNVNSKTNKDNGSAVSSSLLPSGSYVAKAGGTFKYRGNTGLLADSRFSERMPGDPTYGGTYVPWSAGITGWLYMNGDNTVWGNVFSSSTHTYYAPLAGGSNAKFYVGDSDHKDNAGSLTVDIYKGFTGVTTENGCVSFEDVPYGDYTVEELLQSGWTNLSGLGHVTVSSESNRFTVMNSDGTQDENPDPKTMILSGYKFNDADGDGYWDEDEDGISGWTIKATNGEESTTTVTDKDGYYEMEVPEGYWTVSEVMQDGWEQTVVKQNGVSIEASFCDFPIADYYEYEFPTVSPSLVSKIYKGPEYECTFGNKVVPVIDGGNPGDGGNGNQTTTSGGKSKTKKKPTPQVLGAATSTAPVLCPFLKDYMQRETKNDSFEVTKLQMFLSIVMGLPTPVTGIFDTTTEANVKLFQEKYRSEILDPWFKRGIVPHDRPTGFVYKTTRWKINDIICPGFEVYPSFDGENLQSNIVIR